MKKPRILPDWLESWMEYNSNSEAPKPYIQWVGLSVIAAVLSRKCFWIWDKIIYPNLYVVLVGPPACRKNSAMDPGKRMLEKLNVNMAADITTMQKLMIRMEENTDNFQEENGPLHTYSALTVFSEEFAVFLGYNNREFIGVLTDWYDCKVHFNYETKHQGDTKIEGVFFNLIGGTTPSLLQDSLTSQTFGGGLNSRIIYVYGNQKDHLEMFPFMAQGKFELWDKLETDLQSIQILAGEFQKDQTYLDHWEIWYPETERCKLKADPRMVGYAGRRPTHAHKIAMLVNASRTGDMILTGDDLRKAITIMEKTEKTMSQTFAGVGKSDTAAVMHAVLTFVRLRKTVMYSEILRHFSYDANDNVMATVIATLEKSNLVSVESKKIGENKRDLELSYIAGHEG